MSSKQNQLLEFPETVYHYTSQKGLLGIIERRAIWATDILYLNDATEFIHTVNLTREFMENVKESISKEDPQLLSEINDSLNLLSWIGAFGIFVSSFSSQPDQLSQWRGYCPNGNGFSIGFNFKKLQQLASSQSFKMVKCIYTREEQTEALLSVLLRAQNRWRQIREIIETNVAGQKANKELGPNFFSELLSVAPILKHEKFCEEQEWRLVSNLMGYYIESKNALPNEQISFREGKSTLLPYTEFKLAKEGEQLPITKIIIGPTPHQELAKNSLNGFLYRSGVLCSVKLSEIPFRSW